MIEIIVDIIKSIGIMTLALFIALIFHLATDYVQDKFGKSAVLGILLAIVFGLVFYLVRTV